MAGEYPFEPKTLKLSSGPTLSYIDEGQGRAVVMLHGNPTWSYFYRNVVQRLSGSARCIVPDHIGCGFSDKPQDYSYTLAQHVENTLELLEAAGVEAFDLIVHDWGGAIGMAVAEALRDRVGRLVVMNTAAFRSQSIPWQINICRSKLFGSLIIRGLNGFAGPATKMAVSQPLPAEVKRGFLHPYQNWHDRIANWAFVQDIPMDTSHPSWDRLVEIEEGLSRLSSKPMLLMWGMKDFCFHPGFLEEWIRRFPKAQTLEWPDAGHYLLEDEKDRCLSAIEMFLRVPIAAQNSE